MQAFLSALRLLPELRRLHLTPRADGTNRHLREVVVGRFQTICGTNRSLAQPVPDLAADPLFPYKHYRCMVLDKT